MSISKITEAILSGTPTREAIERYFPNILKEAKSLGYNSGGLTSKMWILPNGTPVSLGAMHMYWIQDNPDQIAKFGMDPKRVKRMRSEDTIRKYALQHGFVRVNFEHREGRITFEGLEKFWKNRVKDAAFSIVADNLEKIYAMSVYLFNDKVTRITKDGHEQLFQYDDKEKLNHLPLI